MVAFRRRVGRREQPVHLPRGRSTKAIPPELLRSQSRPKRRNPPRRHRPKPPQTGEAISCTAASVKSLTAKRFVAHPNAHQAALTFLFFRRIGETLTFTADANVSQCCSKADFGFEAPSGSKTLGTASAANDEPLKRCTGDGSDAASCCTRTSKSEGGSSGRPSLFAAVTPWRAGTLRLTGCARSSGVASKAK